MRKDLKEVSRGRAFQTKRDSKCKGNDEVKEGQDAKSGVEQAGRDNGDTVAEISQPSTICD